MSQSEEETNTAFICVVCLELAEDPYSCLKCGGVACGIPCTQKIMEKNGECPKCMAKGTLKHTPAVKQSIQYDRITCLDCGKRVQRYKITEGYHKCPAMAQEVKDNSPSRPEKPSDSQEPEEPREEQKTESSNNEEVERVDKSDATILDKKSQKALKNKRQKESRKLKKEQAEENKIEQVPDKQPVQRQAPEDNVCFFCSKEAHMQCTECTGVFCCGKNHLKFHKKSCSKSNLPDLNKQLLHEGVYDKIKDHPALMQTIKRDGYDIQNLWPEYVEDGQNRQLEPSCLFYFGIKVNGKVEGKMTTLYFDGTKSIGIWRDGKQINQQEYNKDGKLIDEFNN